MALNLKLPPVSIIVPVYGDWESLEKNAKSLKRNISRFSRNQVFFVNDCGPEANQIEQKLLQLIGGRKNFFYHRNSENMGFVKTCNFAALTLADKNNDVLLLNSDAVTTKSFLVEMQKVLYVKGDIGAVCPRSNSATIFSVPMSPDRVYSMDESYRIYKQLKRKLPKYYLSPIAHGFCILIRRDMIDRFGLFDEIYGKGYGEENDFCMRIRERGFKCAVANRAFVFHYKARSFTAERREELVEKNEKILIQRFPGYRQLIQDYVEHVQSIEG